MSVTAPGRAAYQRRHPGPDAIPWEELLPERRAEWEAIAQAAIAAYIEANGDPVDLSSVVIEAITGERKRIAAECDAVLAAEILKNAGEEHTGSSDPAEAATAYVRYLEEELAATTTAFTALRAELAAADRATAEFRRQCSELAGELGAARAVVREMRAHWEGVGTTREEDELMPGWMHRAGVGER